MMKIALIIFLGFPLLLHAHVDGGINRRRCPEAPVYTTPRTLDQMQGDLSSSRIEIMNTVEPANVERFLWEYNKFPTPLRQEMINRGAKIRLMEGTGVGIDPSLTAVRTTEGLREWVNVPGSGGFKDDVPTRIAVNHLYDSHGSAGLVLHEHAHTLDNLYDEKGLSNSETWMNLMNANNPGSREFTVGICGQYCMDREEERFAELFAYYFSCSATREHMEEQLPQVAEFFRNLTSARDMMRGRAQSGSPNAPAPETPRIASGDDSRVPASNNSEECNEANTNQLPSAIKPLLEVNKVVGKSIYSGPSLKVNHGYIYNKGVSAQGTK